MTTPTSGTAKIESDSGSGPVFHRFFTSAPDPQEKPRILPESTPALRIYGQLCQLRHCQY